MTAEWIAAFNFSFSSASGRLFSDTAATAVQSLARAVPGLPTFVPRGSSRWRCEPLRSRSRLPSRNLRNAYHSGIHESFRAQKLPHSTKKRRESGVVDFFRVFLNNIPISRSCKQEHHPALPHSQEGRLCIPLEPSLDSPLLL